jgi:exonuclease VII large subunit
MQLSRFFRLISRSFAAATLFSLVASAPALHAQKTQEQHLISPAQMQQQVQNTTLTRQQNIDTLNQFVSTPQAVQAMKDAKIDPVQVKNAIPTLSNAELANLTARAQHAQQQFAAGGLGTLAIALIIIAVVLIILLAAYH